jgi:outer membrane murein-binding lipoprotein Lpp
VTTLTKQNRTYATSQVQDLNAKISSASRDLKAATTKLKKEGGLDDEDSALGKAAKDR